MAGDWIKMRTFISLDSKVIGMADYLSSQNAVIALFTGPFQAHCKESLYEYIECQHLVSIVVSKLLLTWGVASERGKPEGNDLVLSKSTVWTIDAISGIPCFGEAMEYVGWISCEQDQHGFDSIRFVNYLEDNTCVEDRRRIKNAQYQRDSRQRRAAANCQQPVSTQSAPREEKRRVEETPPNPPPGGGPEIQYPEVMPTPRGNKPAKAITPLPGFAEFWAAYPKKKAKGRAVKAWNKIAPNAETLARILSAIASQKVSEPTWQGNAGRYIPLPATWLNDLGWEDEDGVETAPVPPPSLNGTLERLKREDAEAEARRAPPPGKRREP